jgi:hypothetical protein
MFRQRNAVALIAIVAASVVLGCAGGTAAPVAAPATGASQDRSAALATGAPQGQTNDQQPGALASPDAALIIHTGTMDLEVTDLQATVDQANGVISGLGGQVASSDQLNSANKQVATVTYRIPADRWNDALAGLRGLGQKVLSETTGSEDVTAQVVDLDARISNLRASEAALQAIMVKATTITDVLKVQDELTSVRGDIESMTAQRDHLANQAAFATLTVNFQVPVVETNVASQGWDLGHEIDAAVAALVRLGQGSASVLIWLAVVVLPIVIVLAVILYIGYRIRRRWLATRPAPAPYSPYGQFPPPPPAQGPSSSDT